MRITDDKIKISRIKSYHKNNNKIIKQNKEEIKTKNLKTNE